MSTAAKFGYATPFPYDCGGGSPPCIQSITPGVIGAPDDGIWFGPFSLADAMAIIWNAETITFVTTGASQGVTGASQPNERVCAPDTFEPAGSPFNSAFLTRLFPEVGQNGGNYYLRLAFNAFFPQSDPIRDAFLTNFPNDLSASIQLSGTTFSGTVLGISVTFYLQYDMSSGSISSFPGTPECSASASYYTY